MSGKSGPKPKNPHDVKPWETPEYTGPAGAVGYQPGLQPYGQPPQWAQGAFAMPWWNQNAQGQPVDDDMMRQPFMPMQPPTPPNPWQPPVPVPTGPQIDPRFLEMFGDKWGTLLGSNNYGNGPAG